MEYRKEKLLGKGGFGVVDLVKDEEGRKWARKTFKAPEDTDTSIRENLRERFKREVVTQKDFAHPNIVRIHEYNLKFNPLWFVMDLAECGLDIEIQEYRNHQEGVRKLLFDILSGLQEIHEKGFIHRDLKPANILKIRDEDGSFRYAISDFGLVTHPESNQTNPLTGVNMHGGTPDYRAPECAIGLALATEMSDIYSVGAILYDIYGETRRRKSGSKLTIENPPELREIIEKCTEKYPEDRYRTVALLRDALYVAFDVEDIQRDTRRFEVEYDINNLLASSDSLSGDEWNKVLHVIQGNEDLGRGNDKIFKALSPLHISQLASKESHLLDLVGKAYARYAQGGEFEFEYCDIIANRAQMFFKHGSIGVKAEIAVAILNLGTRHNRWHAEKMFMRMAGNSISDNIAKRIRHEIEIQSIDFEKKFSLIERAISASRDDLHPAIRSALGEDKKDEN